MKNHQVKSIREFLRISCERAGNNNLLSVLEMDPHKREPVIHSISGSEFQKQARELSNSQKIFGVGDSARVALIGEASVNWVLNFFACLLNGVTLCPVDNKLTVSEIDSQLDHFGATHILVSDSLWEKLVILKSVEEHRVKLIKFSDFQKLPLALVENLIESSLALPGDPDLIIYTSGTSSHPKAAVISLSSLYFESQTVNVAIFPPEKAKRVVFSILPLNHIYGLSFGLFCTFWSGNEFCLTQSLEPQSIQRITREQKVTCFITIPLLLTLLKNGIENKVSQQSPAKRFLFNLAMAVNRKLRSVSIAKWIFKEIRESFGKDIEYFISGGAAIDPLTINFYEALGWPVYHGYGLTETGPLLSANSPFGSKRGTVGHILAGVEVKIENGEICTRGPHVFKYYLKAEDLTQKAFTSDGWFRTGDLGSLDSDGYLTIQGRSKSMIVLSSGKKVQPEEVEDLLMGSKYVKLACLAPTRNKGLSEKLVAVLELHQNYSDSIKDQNFKDEVTAELNKLCLSIADFKRPQSFIFRQDPFPMTSSQKIKRHLVQIEIENSL
ncbi:MAG: AMP-binding protein [Pseudobdellovibrionaceae bacterium]